MVMAEKQSDHRIKQEDKVVSADIRRANLGLGAGFVVAIAGLASSYFLVDGGNTVAGVTVATVDLGGLVSAFIYGTVSRRSERKQRARMMTGQS